MVKELAEHQSAQQKRGKAHAKSPSQHPWTLELQKGDRKGAYMMFIGVNGTGKSTMMKRFFEVNRRNLVLPSNSLDASQTWGPFPKIQPTHFHVQDKYQVPGKQKMMLRFALPQIRTFTGNRIVDVSVFQSSEHKKAFFEGLCDTNTPTTRYTDGGLFVDDTRGYIATKGSIPEMVANMLIARRHLMLDIFFAFHAFQDVNSDLIKYGPRFFIFKTDLPPNDTVMEKIARADDLLEMIQYVNDRAKTDPYYFEPFDPVDALANQWTRENRK